ncbi:MAG: hypothetical protein E7Z97_01175 [Propionibacteriaceae bacterium]|nr:hypothetical protein [Propionibacteriaceae bacterium]
MKKSIPAALAGATAALLIPSMASACPADCGWSGDHTRVDVKDHASTKTDTTMAQKEVDHARSFKDAGAHLSQSERDCFLGKVLAGSYYDKGSRTIRTDAGARVNESTDLEHFSHSGGFKASEFSYWLYEHEDTWWSSSSHGYSYQVGDVLSFSKKGQFTTNQTSAEFFSSVTVVAIYVGDGRVIYCANDGSSTQIKETSIATLEAELNITVSLVSRPCDDGDSSSTPSEQSSSTPVTNAEDGTDEDEADGDGGSSSHDGDDDDDEDGRDECE